MPQPAAALPDSGCALEYQVRIQPVFPRDRDTDASGRIVFSMISRLRAAEKFGALAGDRSPRVDVVRFFHFGVCTHFSDDALPCPAEPEHPIA